MQGIDLGTKLRASRIIDDDIVGRRQSLLTTGLGGHDHSHFIGTHATARHDPLDLQIFRAVDDEDTVATLTIGPGFNQQRHGQDDVG